MDEMAVIEKVIDIKRQQLNAYVTAFGLSDPVCLQCSMELDELINRYTRLTSRRSI